MPSLQAKRFWTRNPAEARHFFLFFKSSRPAVWPIHPSLQAALPQELGRRCIKPPLTYTLVPRLRMSGTILSFPPYTSMACEGTAHGLTQIFLCFTQNFHVNYRRYPDIADSWFLLFRLNHMWLQREEIFCFYSLQKTKNEARQIVCQVASVCACVWQCTYSIICGQIRHRYVRGHSTVCSSYL